MTKSFAIKSLIVAACLSLVPAWAHAEDKARAPKKPTVHRAEACQQVALKGALGFSDAESKPVKDTAMLCQTKSNVRVLREWRLEGWGDGDMFVVGR